jgi:phage repressor protein C with HTH and peptisase S24 domain
MLRGFVMLTLADRIKSLIGSGSANAFARKCEIGESSLRQYLAGGIPNAVIASRIAAAGGVSLDWLVNGEAAGQAAGQAAAPQAMLDDSFSLVPRLAVDASAGAGAVNHTEETVQMLAFRTDWLHRLGLVPSSARALTVRGDSMAPTLQHGDLVLVDTAIERVDDAGIYVVGVDDRTLVKRIQPKFDGSLALISENPVYAPEEIPAGATDKLRVLGRVRWYGRAI